jgi:glycosyltransferase involved in cell wall biosynthesis
VTEFCLSTASPVTDAPRTFAYRPRAQAGPRLSRPVLRHTDLAALVLAWRRLSAAVDEAPVDVVYANPCRFLQGPLVTTMTRRPTLYFCDEPRRVDYEPAAIASRSSTTRWLYAPLYGAERRLDRRSVAAATELVTNSRFTAGRIERAYGRPAAVVPLGVADSFRAAGDLPGGHLLSVGTLIPSKGHDLVIESAAAMRTPREVVIVGPRHEPAEERRLLDIGRAVGARVEIRVGIDDAELRALYATAHATLYLAREEPFGLASLEAQACGCPVVVADEGGLPETIEDGVTGFAVVRRAAEVTRALELLEDPARRAAVAQSARDRGAQATWERSSHDVQQRLEALAARGAATAP